MGAYQWRKRNLDKSYVNWLLYSVSDFRCYRQSRGSRTMTTPSPNITPVASPTPLPTVRRAKVSVCIPTYNEGTCLVRTVESVQAVRDESPGCEIVIADDG